MAARGGYEEDMLEDMDEDVPAPRVKSTVAARKQKGRGFREGAPVEDDDRHGRGYESLGKSAGAGPQESVEGWVLFISNVHEEATEEDIYEMFSEVGEVKHTYLNLDRRTGYVKGYAMVEYATKAEAQEAIKSFNNAELLTQQIGVTWCFSKGPTKKPVRARR